MIQDPKTNYSKYKVMILCAGLGTRLSSVTNGLMPKVMMPIADNLPLIAHTLQLLRSQGFSDFILNLHYMPEKITTYLENGSNLGVKIEYSDETDRILNTAGAIKKAEGSLSENFLLLYGDMVHFTDFRPILDFHLKNNSILTAVLKKSDHPQNVDLAEINPATFEVKKWHFRPHSINQLNENLFTNSGLYVISKKILNLIPPNETKSLDAEIIPLLIKSGEKVYGYPSPGDILDIGSPDRYEFAKKWYSEQVRERDSAFK